MKEKRLRRVEKVILFLFVFLFPTQLAYHFWPNFAYVFGLRVDYLAPTVSLTDLVFVLLIPFWLKRVRRIKTSAPFLFFLAFLLLNIFGARVPVLAALKTLNLLKYLFVVFYFRILPPDAGKVIRQALTTSLLLFSVIGLWQFLLQRSGGGLLYFLGERHFSIATPGIALVNLFGKSVLRIYSTFSHPNSLAGFFGASLLIIWSLGEKRKLWLVLPLLTFGLTFSLGAFLGAAFILGIFLSRCRIPPRLFILVLIGFSFLLVFLPPSLLRPHESYLGRVQLAQQALALYERFPLLGIGLNNFPVFSSTFQPVHNLFLLSLVEAGLAGLAGLYVGLVTLLVKCRQPFLKLALLFILLTGLFDHYWLTLPQNLYLLSLLAGLILNVSFFAKLKDNE